MAAGNALDRMADQYGYGPIPPPVYVPPPGLPPPVAVPAAQPIAQPTITPVPKYNTTDPLLTPQFRDAILNSALYKQEMENIARYEQTQKNAATFNAEWDKKFYDLNRSQIAGSFTPSFVPQYGAGEEQAKQLDALAKANAARDLANQQEYSREALGSRGLGSSGQVALERQELQYDFDTFTKEVDLRAEARAAELAQTRANAAASAAASNANQQRSISNQLADLDLRNQYGLAQAQQNAQVLAADIASRNGDALFKVADRLIPFYFDADGNYKGPGGQVLTPEQAQATIAPAAPQPALPPPPPPAPPPPTFNTPRSFLNL